MDLVDVWLTAAQLCCGDVCQISTRSNKATAIRSILKFCCLSLELSWTDITNRALEYNQTHLYNVICYIIALLYHYVTCMTSWWLYVSCNTCVLLTLTLLFKSVLFLVAPIQRCYRTFKGLLTFYCMFHDVCIICYFVE